MSPLKFFSCARIVISALCCVQLFSINLQAVEFELTPIVGKTFSPDLVTGDNAFYLPTTDEPNFALALSWQDTPTGQGQVLVNYISRDFTDNIDFSTHSFDTVYAHFSGVSLFIDREYVTTVGVGIGATYFKSDFDSAVYPSLTVAVGTRYQFDDNLVFVTELRGYATLTDDDDTLFCQSEICYAQFERAVWLDGQISVGLAYSF